MTVVKVRLGEVPDGRRIRREAKEDRYEDRIAAGVADLAGDACLYRAEADDELGLNPRCSTRTSESSVRCSASRLGGPMTGAGRSRTRRQGECEKRRHRYDEFAHRTCLLFGAPQSAESRSLA